MLEISNLSVKKYGKTLLGGVNLSVSEAGLHALVGPNGAGKTTFLRGFLENDEGEILLDGRNISNLNIKQKSKIISYLPQFSSILDISVKQTLNLARHSKKGAFLEAGDKEKIAATIDEFALAPLIERRLMELSGGVRQKVLIAATLLEEPRVLLLDEPISHLDPKNQSEVLSLLAHCTKERGIYAFIVLHDLSHAMHYSASIAMIKSGRLLAHKKAEEIDETDINALFDVHSRLYEVENHKFVYYSHKHF